MVGTSEVNWALEFLIMNEFDHKSISLDVHYKCNTWQKKDTNSDEMISIPVRREVKLNPNNVNWNHRLEKVVDL